MRLLMIGLIATTMLVGCSKNKHSHSKSDHDHSMHAEDGMHGEGNMHGDMDAMHHMDAMHRMHAMHMDHGDAMGDMAAGGKVTVAKDGQKFKPPVKPSQLPDGVWYCDMGGSVHYARGEKGDGKCPLCHMKLHHKAASM